MRLFLALELPPATADEIHAAVAAVRDEEPGLAWVPASKLHLTLKFLGDGDEPRVAALAAACDTIAARHKPFEMLLAGVGAFPNFRRARVVWLGVESEPRLELLHHDVELAAADAGYEVDGRPFRPHITLARIREALPADRGRALARSARAISYSATVFVDRVTLFDSATDGSGARYRRLHTASLGGS
jgi:RNA 2',3'-cyclic 3'-phosphodiesterase